MTASQVPFDQVAQWLSQAMDEVHKVVVGQQDLVEGIFIGLLTGGHVLVEGVPGLAKTLTISTVAKVSGLEFKRVQFTPDLLPSDITGTLIFLPRKSEFVVQKGPVFTHILLADEINRASPKVQSALLEAMAERQVTLGNDTYRLPEPFLVLATQNPIEQEGTYPLPEAQLDRFLIKILVTYPDKAAEKIILQRMAYRHSPQPETILSVDQVKTLMAWVDQVHVEERLANAMVDLVVSSRQPAQWGLGEVQEWLQLGASPRATIALHKASRAMALLRGRDFVTWDDVKKVAPWVLRHRLLLSYGALAQGVTTDQLIHKLLEAAFG